MNSYVFSGIVFLPFAFSLWLLVKRILLSNINRNVLKFGFILISLVSFLICLFNFKILQDAKSIFYLFSNSVFLFISVYSYIFFKKKKQFIFTCLRYYVFLSLLMSLTNLFIYFDNLISSFLVWIFTGVLIYLFSFYDIFKTTPEYNPNRFYSIFLLGDFALLLSILILAKYVIIFDNYSYLLKFSDISSISDYIYSNSKPDYMILTGSFLIALFSRGLIFPFSCFFSFLTNASSIFYLNIFASVVPLYSLILFIKLNLFTQLNPYLKIYLILSALLTLFGLLFEKHLKIIFGYLLSILASFFAVFYFYNSKQAFLGAFLVYAVISLVAFVLFLYDKTSFKRRFINIKRGFLFERLSILIFEKFPLKVSHLINFIEGKIFLPIIAFFKYIIEILCFRYMVFVSGQKASRVVRGILLIYTLFIFLAVFIALFGNFGEMQS